MLKIQKVREQQVRRLSAGGYQQGAIKARNGDTELSSNATLGGTSRVIGRIESWFHRPNPEQLNRDLDRRLEQRYRQRARIVRELHDTLFQRFSGCIPACSGGGETTP